MDDIALGGYRGRGPGGPGGHRVRGLDFRYKYSVSGQSKRLISSSCVSFIFLWTSYSVLQTHNSCSLRTRSPTYFNSSLIHIIIEWIIIISLKKKREREKKGEKPLCGIQWVVDNSFSVGRVRDRRKGKMLMSARKKEAPSAHVKDRVLFFKKKAFAMSMATAKRHA